jgi:hypothetical protein
LIPTTSSKAGDRHFHVRVLTTGSCKPSYSECVDDIPRPLRGLLAVWSLFDLARGMILYLLCVGIAVALLIFGTTLARGIGCGLLFACGLIAYQAVHRRKRPRTSRR